MATRPTTSGDAFERFLDAQQNKDVLRFITCGSVDDGKSTLIGRLLHDTKQLFDDQLASLHRASARRGLTDQPIDFASLVDGLAAEREQGITIDVAYRFFATDRRTFIVADTPGHEQYTRNMATAASTAELAVLLVDARRGLTRQTQRHSLIVSMLGIRHVVLAINKMDLVGWSQDRYDAIVEQYGAFAAELNFASIEAIPLSALNGDNVAQAAVATPWYRGPTLLQHLETVSTADHRPSGLRLAVQSVLRPNAEFRGYAGLIAAGSVSIGQAVRIMPAGTRSRVARVLTPNGDQERGVAGQSVVVVLDGDVDVSRGDVIVDADATVSVSDRVSSRIFWTSDTPLRAGASFDVKLATSRALARVTDIACRIDPDSARQEAAAELAANDIGEVVMSLDRALAVEPYRQGTELGSFILIDRESAETVGIGLIVAA